MQELFNVNLLDPDDVQEKMPQIKQLYAERKAALRALEDQIELLRRLIGEKPSSGTNGLARKRTKPARKTGQRRPAISAPGQDRAVTALEQAGVPMGPATLHRYMVDNGLPTAKDANALGSNLWSAWKAGRIERNDNGTYTPLTRAMNEGTDSREPAVPTAAPVQSILVNGGDPEPG
jgi:hypothetical protein